jgi:hypothetical protein
VTWVISVLCQAHDDDRVTERSEGFSSALPNRLPLGKLIVAAWPRLHEARGIV